MKHRVVLATRNQHKVAELRRILASSGLDVDLVGTESFPDLPGVAETGSTFAANALLMNFQINSIDEKIIIVSQYFVDVGA